MSFYGAKISDKYTIHKRRLQANGEFRFGGLNTLLAYRVPEAPEGPVQVPVEQSDSDPAVLVLRTGSSECVSVAVKPNDANITINALQLVDFNGELKLEHNMHAVLLEGSMTLASGEVHNSDLEIPVVVAQDSELTLTGTGKLLTFTL
jgi:hypothetical protein